MRIPYNAFETLQEGFKDGLIGHRRHRSTANLSSSLFLAQPFMSQSMYFSGTSYIDLSGSFGLSGATNVTLAAWFRYDSSGWVSGLRTILARTSVNNRQLQLIANPRGGLGEVQVGFGNGTTMFNRYFSDGTFFGDWWHHVVVSYASGTVNAYADGISGTISGSDNYPASLGTSNINLRVGAGGSGSSPSNLWFGGLCNVAVWNNWSANAAQARRLWGFGEAIDLRTVTGSDGIPAMSTYLPMNSNPTQELASGTAITHTSMSMWAFTGTYGDPALARTNMTRVPWDRVFEDAVFERRFLINTGDEPWLSNSNGSGGRNYNASPSFIRITSGSRSGSIMWSYSRGVDHTTLHTGSYGYSDDDGRTFGISGRDWPYSSSSYAARAELVIPHGVLADGSKRSMTLSAVDISGTQRMFCIFNETEGPAAVRNTWFMSTDNAGVSWTTGTQFIGSGSSWTSVGRARVVKRTDGSLLFPYYTQNDTENTYDAAIARSTNGGATWSHYRTVASAPDRNAGARFEEPYLFFVTGTLFMNIRVDSGIHPNIMSGANLNGVHLRARSNDEGDTWQTPVALFSGTAHPFVLVRPSDGLQIAPCGFPPSGTQPIRAPRFQVSHNGGGSWSSRYIPPSPFTELYMQGDMMLTQDNKVMWLWAQEHNGLQCTHMWCGVFREDFLAAMTGNYYYPSDVSA